MSYFPSHTLTAFPKLAMQDKWRTRAYREDSILVERLDKTTVKMSFNTKTMTL